MKRSIKVSFTSSASIEQAIEELEQYKQELHTKVEEFVSRLIDAGIETAHDNEGEYAGMIKFQKQITTTDDGLVGLLIASDGAKIVREWRFQGGTKYAVVSPLLMAEFGSGWLSKVLDNVPGVGQGTFPGQTHAFDPHGWWWTTPDGVTHHSIGETPTYPMHAAVLAMLFEVDAIGKEVFNGR